MIKKLLVITTVMMFLATGYAMAEDVYTTAKGTKYHKENCRLLKNKESAVKLEKNEAIAHGFTPCGRCFKEDLVKAEPTTKIK